MPTLIYRLKDRPDLGGVVTEWWLFPNTPHCPHAGVFHDIEDYEDEDTTPRCTIDGCNCGARALDVPIGEIN